MRRLAAEIERLKKVHGYRALTPARGRDFSSNDYLGFSRHPALRQAVIDALQKGEPVGAGGSRLLRGNHPAHGELETRAAEFFGVERALYFSSGFLANFALFSTLCERHDAIVFDERIHASVKDGIHASHAKRYRARHNDVASFEDALHRARAAGARQIWIAVESVYSMDGDLAPLEELAAIAHNFEAALVVDEAHATGIFGPTGRGAGETLGANATISVHTCGKALGVAGALICGHATVIDYLINKARPFIFSTAPSPLMAVALTRALALIDEEPWRRKKLLALTVLARDVLQWAAGDAVRFGGSQIVPVVLKDEARTLAVAGRLQGAGFDVRAIRPPTVPAGTSRLRVSINVEHSEDDIRELAVQLKIALAAEGS